MDFVFLPRQVIYVLTEWPHMVGLSVYDKMVPSTNWSPEHLQPRVVTCASVPTVLHSCWIFSRACCFSYIFLFISETYTYPKSYILYFYLHELQLRGTLYFLHIKDSMKMGGDCCNVWGMWQKMLGIMAKYHKCANQIKCHRLDLMKLCYYILLTNSDNNSSFPQHQKPSSSTRCPSASGRTSCSRGKCFA